MQFKVNSKDLEKLLTKIIPAVPSRTPMPVLENFLFEIKDGLLTIYATDLEISLKSSLNIVAEENLSIVVPAKLLVDVVKTLGNTAINFNVEPNGKILLSTDSGKYALSYLPAEEFPEIPSFPANVEEDENLSELSMNGKELKKALDYAAFAMSREEIRPAMMGTLFEFCEEGLKFVATDGHRLSNFLKKNVSLSSEEKYIVPERAVSVLQKVLDEKDVNIFFSKTHISFRLSDIELITRLIGQKYPDYRAVIPLENEYRLIVETKKLQDVIKRMMLFSSSSTKKVKFSISENNLEISAEDIDMGASGVDNLPCEYSGEPLDIGFNSGYINDILSHLNSEEKLVFKLHSPTKAVIILPVEEKENQELMMLLMPVRLNN